MGGRSKYAMIVCLQHTTRLILGWLPSLKAAATSGDGSKYAKHSMLAAHHEADSRWLGGVIRSGSDKERWIDAGGA